MRMKESGEVCRKKVRVAYEDGKGDLQIFSSILVLSGLSLPELSLCLVTEIHLTRLPKLEDFTSQVLRLGLLCWLTKMATCVTFFVSRATTRR
jgi:hypothetical protein